VFKETYIYIYMYTVCSVVIIKRLLSRLDKERKRSALVSSSKEDDDEKEGRR